MFYLNYSEAEWFGFENHLGLTAAIKYNNIPINFSIKHHINPIKVCMHTVGIQEVVHSK